MKFPPNVHQQSHFMVFSKSSAHNTGPSYGVGVYLSPKGRSYLSDDFHTLTKRVLNTLISVFTILIMHGTFMTNHNLVG
jgi:hypothetical protein